MKIWLLSLFFSLGNHVFAQQFGGNPTTIHWKQINTDTARIIFPEELSDVAKRVASVVHDLQKNHTATIGNSFKKINIVLQNQTTVSNAYVGLGPFRSEFYLFAPQNSFELGALSWADNLSIHEYRHVEQYNNFNVGLSKVAGILFGEQGRALANAAAVPDWFFEGDAVFNETSLSRQGRGRLPDFFNGYVTLFQQQKKYSYIKLRNGSLKHYVPNHYPLGYMLVGYGREKYGADFWKNITQDAARFKPLVYPWQNAVKKYSGVSYEKFVNDAFDYYQNQWQQAKATPFTYKTAIHTNNVTDYQYPYTDSFGNIIVLKTSYRSIPAFYKISPEGKEEKIATRDIANDNYFSYNNGLIVYTSYKADRRWGYLEYSDIKLLNTTTGEVQKLTNKGRYFSPDISHDGLKIIAVEMNTNQQSNLVAMNLHGDVLFRSKAVRGVIYTYPKFSANDSFIYVATRNESGEMALLKLELATAKETMSIPYANRIIGLPTVVNDTVIFTSTYKGSDEAWAYIDSKKSAYRLATNATGLYHPALDNSTGNLVAANFTADGYRLAVISKKDLLWQKINEKENPLPDLYIGKALKQEKSTTLENIPLRNFSMSKYSKSYNLFHYHSWRPTYSDPEISFSLLGENILNTLQSEISYTYNRNESSHNVGFNGIYGGWFLQPVLGISQTFNRNVAYNADTSFYYNEFNANAGLRLPLNFSAGKHYTNLTLNTSINNQQVQWTGLSKQLLRNQTFFYWQNSVQFSNQIQQARQHIYPHWAQTLTLQYRTIVDKYNAHQFLASGSVYLPGLLPTHNIILSAAYQGRDTMGQYSFSNSFPFSRGYNGLNYPRMWKVGGNYHFPLVYPDWGFGNIVYFKRIRANGFYDYSQIKSLRSGLTFSFKTTGVELFFDTRWWNQQNVTFGIRYSRLLDADLVRMNPNQWEFILPVGLFK